MKQPGCSQSQMDPLPVLESKLTCGGLGPNMNAWVVSAQQVLDEGGFASAVLSQQQNRGLGLKVRFCQKG